MSTTFDSDKEESFYNSILADTAYTKTLPKEYLDITTISAGVQYDSITDFKDCSRHALPPLIEYKCAALNGKTTRALALKYHGIAMNEIAHLKYSNPKQYKKMKSYIDLAHSWSNSVHKHGQVNSRLPPLGQVHVFEYKMTLNDAKRYGRAGLIFCAPDEVRSLISYVMLARAGLQTSFTTYCVEGVAITYNLAAIFQYQTLMQKLMNPSADTEPLPFKVGKPKRAKKLLVNQD